ncbi:MAG: metabolite traffic protein EboE [Pseudomonadota bacterium]
MKLPGDLGHLTYCLNIHPAETWNECRAALSGPVAAVKQALCPDDPFTVGLRFSAVATEALEDTEARADLKQILAAHDFQALTVNGFPYGPFHGPRVKEDVYQPDWTKPERAAYTIALAELMADLNPQGAEISLSTVPGTFKPLGAGQERKMADYFLRCAAFCHDVREQTRRTVQIAIEPEPFCFLETIAETVAFFDKYLFSDAAVTTMSGLTGLSRGDAAAALPRHLGLCYDVCHAAVEYEDPAGSITALRSAGIPVHKLQLSAALRVPSVDGRARKTLAAFDEPTYLHQVVSRRGETLHYTSDLQEALARLDSDGEEWRIHFHVPLFVDDIPPFKSTQDFLGEILKIHRQAPISNHLEVETYTWGVLPGGLRGESIEDDIAREMRWVLDRLDIGNAKTSAL